MPPRLSHLLGRLSQIEQDVERELNQARTRLSYRLVAGRVRFEQDVRRAHKRIKQSIPRFVWQASLLHILTAPVIYSLVIPVALLDLWMTAYQWICFPIYGIERVSRSTYVVVDRHHLAYLNGIEKLNCVFCGYANGVLAYAREVAGRTELYWCPIRHARRTKAPHRQYHEFLDYGDAEGYRRRLLPLRDDTKGKP